jgi:hypothetical protein
MVGGRRRDVWVFLKGRDGRSPHGAVVELADRASVRRAGLVGQSGPYLWMVFQETPHGSYTVRVTYPSGAQQTAHLTVDQVVHTITLDEPPQPARQP